MEEIILRTCVLLASLLCLNDYTVVEELDDDITLVMPEQKHFQLEGVKLENQVPTVSIELPHSDQEVSQSHHRLTKEEADIQQILPNGRVKNTDHHQMPQRNDQDILYQKLLIENNLDKQEMDKTVLLSDNKASDQAPNINDSETFTSLEIAMSETVHPGQDETKHTLSKENKIVSPEKKVTVDKEEILQDVVRIVQDVDTSNEYQNKEIQAPPLSNTILSEQKDLNLGQMGMTKKQKPSEEANTIIHEEHTTFFQKIVDFLHQWSQTSQEKHVYHDDELLKDIKQSQMQTNERTDKKIHEQAPINRRNSTVDQGQPLDSHEPPHTGQVQTKSIEHSGSENSYTWFLWNVLSLMSLIRLLRKFFSKDLKSSGAIFPTMENKKSSKSAKLTLPDHDVLSCFYDQCVRTPPNICERTFEFVEGFVDELLEAMRNTNNKETDMQIEDFIGVGSLYELRPTGKRAVCDLYVTFTAPRLYSFDFMFGKEKGLSLVAGCGKIKMMKSENTLNSCPCSTGTLDDTLCLLHPHNETNSAITDASGGPLCQENTLYLSKARVVRWFKAAVSKAWDEIRHKYEFELMMRNQVAPGALKVRFRSGQTILFNITPVVQVKGSKVHLVSYLTSNQSSFSDTDWPISVAEYENALLHQFDNTLPHNSCHIRCLQILTLLHKQQISLTGNCGLTSYHLKTALLHLLLVTKPTAWKCEQLTERLTDILIFLEQRLQEKKLHHALLGNPLVPSDIGLPKEFQVAKPMNLFLPLALNKDLYMKTIQHLQELMRNSPLLIQEYVSIKNSTGELKPKASF